VPTIFPAHDTAVYWYHCHLTPCVCNKWRRILDFFLSLWRFERDCARSSRSRRGPGPTHSKMDELDGGGSCTGGSIRIGPSVPIRFWSESIGRYFVHSAEATAAPTHALLTLGTASSLSGAEIEGPKFESSPCTHRRLCTRHPHTTAGPTGKRMM